MHQPNIFIVGSGRSGTSTIARLCHEDLGTCMGHYIKAPNFMNPTGFYEDMISHALVVTTATMGNAAYDGEFYLKVMNDQHSNCLAWGAKDPWFLYLPIDVLKAIKPRLCVIATRTIEKTVQSWLKIWEHNNPGKPVPDKVVEYYTNLTEDRTERAEQIGNVWPNVIQIDFTNHVSEDDIKEKIRQGLSSANLLK